MINKPCAIALGFFDGVHIAHKKIISCAVEYAKENSLTPLVLSFDRSPQEILVPGKVKYLTTCEQKQRIISSLGAQAVFLPMSAEFLSIAPEDFIRDILIEKYDIKFAICGYNYRFGRGGRGNTQMLSHYGGKLGFKVKVLDRETYKGESISSSRIRELISEGNISLANELLGRNFFVEGIVCNGKHLGHEIGFPTANVFFEDAIVIPKNGVYKTFVTVEDKQYKAITNTGINPTVGGETLRTETHIPHFHRDIYGKKIKIEFLDFLRDEKKFDSVEELVAQIKKDLERL